MTKFWMQQKLSFYHIYGSRNTASVDYCFKGVGVADFDLLRSYFWINYQSWYPKNFCILKNNSSRWFLMQYESKLYLLNWWRRYLLTEPPKLSISKNLLFVFSRFCPAKAKFREKGTNSLCVRLLWSLTQKNNEKWWKLKEKIGIEWFFRRLFKSVGVGVGGIVSDYC
jgi:hypothetical protein